MHVQRIHYWKLCLIGLFVTGILFLIASIGDTERNTIDVEVAVVDETLDLAEEEEARTSTQSLSIAQLHSCPTCLGKDLCTEISQGFLTVSMFGKETGEGTEYQGMLNNDERLTVFSPSGDIWESWDKSVCKNSSQWKGCLVGDAAKNSFLFKSKGDAPFLRKMFTLSEKKEPPALTACAGRKLAKTLQEAFDENRDNKVTMEEKAVMLTTVGVSPGTAALRFSSTVGLPPIPRYIGACGRLVLSEGNLVSLNKFLDRDWETRAELARQVLTLVDSLTAVEGWVMMVWDLSWENFSVTKTGQVVLSRLEKLTPIDRAMLAGPPEEERPVCNEQCFTDFKKEVMMVTPRGQPGRGCSTALLYVDLMYAAVCKNIFSNTPASRGLLHSGPQELRQSLQECGVEEGKGGRWQAVDDLIEFLEGDVDDTTLNSSEANDAEDDEYDGDYNDEIDKNTRTDINKKERKQQDEAEDHDDDDIDDDTDEDEDIDEDDDDDESNGNDDGSESGEE